MTQAPLDDRPYHTAVPSCGPFLTRCGMRHPIGSLPVGWGRNIADIIIQTPVTYPRGRARS